MASFCKRSNERSGSVKCGNCFESLRDCLDFQGGLSFMVAGVAQSV